MCALHQPGRPRPDPARQYARRRSKNGRARFVHPHDHAPESARPDNSVSSPLDDQRLQVDGVVSTSMATAQASSTLMRAPQAGRRRAALRDFAAVAAARTAARRAGLSVAQTSRWTGRTMRLVSVHSTAWANGPRAAEAAAHEQQIITRSRPLATMHISASGHIRRAADWSMRWSKGGRATTTLPSRSFLKQTVTAASSGPSISCPRLAPAIEGMMNQAVGFMKKTLDAA